MPGRPTQPNEWVLIAREDNSGGQMFSRAVFAESVGRLYLWGTGGKKPAEDAVGILRQGGNCHRAVRDGPSFLNAIAGLGMDGLRLRLGPSFLNAIAGIGESRESGFA